MLKRLLPLLLILCLMLVSCTTPPAETTAPPTADNGNNNGQNNNNNNNNNVNNPKPVVDVAGVEKDPLGALADASQKTEGVIQDDAKIFDIILGALTEGTTTVTLSSPELLGQMGMNPEAPVSVMLKSDIANGKLYLNALDGMAELYLDGSKLGVQSEALFGFAGTYFADLSDEAKLKTFVEMLMEMFMPAEPAPVDDFTIPDDSGELPADGELGFDPAIIEMYAEQIKAILAALEDYELDIEGIKKAVLDNLKPVVGAEDVKIGGTTVKCISVTYTVDTDTLCDIITAVMAEIEIPADVLDIVNAMVGSEMTEAQIREILAQAVAQIRDGMKAEVAPKVVIKSLINAFTGKMHGMKITVDAKSTSEDYDIEKDEFITVTEDNTFTCELLYADAGREMNFSVKSGDEINAIKASFYRQVNGYDVTYTAKLETEADGEKMILEAPMVYNTKTGVITVTLKMTEGGESEMIIITGSAKAEGNTATFTVDTVTVTEQTLNIGLALTFTKGLSTPITIPATATDITGLTPDDIAELMAQMENGLIFRLIGNMGGGNGELVSGMVPDGRYVYTDPEVGTVFAYEFEGNTFSAYADDRLVASAVYEIVDDQIIAYAIGADGTVSDTPNATDFAMGDGYVIINGAICYLTVPVA